MGERLYLTILRGPSPSEATPVVATEDEEIIRAVGRALGVRLGLDDPSPPADDGGSEARPLRLLDEAGEREQEADEGG